jgi:N-acetylglucosamine-6-phosphate deacetylase
VPRSKNTVKGKLLARSTGLIDLHFHGAFGIDLMSAEAPDLDRLSHKLHAAGLDGFCATTLSTDRPPLLETVGRLGDWISSRKSSHWGRLSLARPLGIHLEGPFLSSQARGAHPPGGVRPLTRSEVLELWDASRGTLKILTVAPEELSPSLLRWLTTWARDRKHVVLSAGHSRATAAQARRAFDAGFSSVTHGWNAMAFHQREPGILGAALGRRGVHVELIGDGVHVAPEVIRWTCHLHREICWVSDCVPAAATRPGTEHPFGPLKVRLGDGASRLADGSLAGGGKLLVEALRDWLEDETQGLGPAEAARVVRQHLRYATVEPLRALGMRWQGSRPKRLSWRTQD